MMKGVGWMDLVLISLLLASFEHVTEARSTGAPVASNPEICSTMTPGHYLPAATTNSPYTMTADVNTFSASQQVTVTITGSPGFKGIFLQMRREDNDEIVGSWTVPNSDTNFRMVSCGGSNAVTHSNSNAKDTTNSFVWTAPATPATYNVRVVATFVQHYSTFWVKVQGPLIQFINPCNSNPCLSGGTCVPTGAGYRCNCPPLYSGPTCHLIVFPCDSNPCQNGGTCMDVNQDTEFVCDCQAGYVGNTCGQIEVINPCNPNPCLSGGTCVQIGAGYRCNCPPLYSGPTCHLIVFPCDSNPCQNGGTCMDINQDTEFVCDCQTGYVGTTCGQIEVINPCNPNPCLSGGTCVQIGAGYRCNCPPPFTGPTCHLLELPCTSNPCAHGGTCQNTNQDSHFQCSCLAGFTGVMCEIAMACHSNPCTNGGTCVSANQESEYSCMCTVGRSGDTCEIAVSSCTDNSCANGATCNGGLGEGAYTCTCPADYTGPLCETSLATTARTTTADGTKVTCNLFMISTAMFMSINAM